MAGATTALVLGFVLAVAALVATPAEGNNNITTILDGFPEFSLYNKYLTETRVADEINTRQTVTCLVLPNADMSALANNHTLAEIKNALLLLTLLDYFDLPKINSLPNGTTLATTLLQTTGRVSGNNGFVNITSIQSDRVTFSPAANSHLGEVYCTNSVKQIPFNISVLEVSAPVVYPGLLDAPAAVNLTAVLEKAGCRTFAGLLVSSGAIKRYQAAMDDLAGPGLTVLAPRDEAFKVHGVPEPSSLSSTDLLAILLYHALPSYTPKASLKALAAGGGGGAIRTLASTGTGTFSLSASSSGDDVSLATGVDISRVTSTVVDVIPVCVLTVDHVLLPTELFRNGPAPAPSKSL